MIKRRIRTISLIIALLLTLFAATTVFAAGSGSITIALRGNGGQTVYGASFRLYKVADADMSGINLRYTLTKDFAGSGDKLNNLDESTAKSLAQYALDKKLTGKAASADKSGKVSFTGLDIGLYLLVQEGTAEGYLAASPFLVSIPMTDLEGTGWIYDVEASPKVERDIHTSPENITVKKVWADENSAARPKKIKIELLRDGICIETVTLSAQNGWTHSWKELAAGHRWQVREADVPKGYVAAYSYAGETVTVTNTSRLIQTDQQNWLIPVLAGAGLLLIILGVALVGSAGRRRHEA